MILLALILAPIIGFAWLVVNGLLLVAETVAYLVREARAQ